MLTQISSDPAQGGDGTLYVVDGLKAWALNNDATRVALEAIGVLNAPGDGSFGHVFNVHPATIELFDKQGTLELID
jgi:hypothetical protein